MTPNMASTRLEIDVGTGRVIVDWSKLPVEYRPEVAIYDTHVTVGSHPNALHIAPLPASMVSDLDDLRRRLAAVENTILPLRKYGGI